MNDPRHMYAASTQLIALAAPTLNPPQRSDHQFAQDAVLVIVGQRAAAIVAPRGIGPVEWEGRAIGHAGKRIFAIKFLVAVFHGRTGYHWCVGPDGQFGGLSGAVA